MKKRIVAALLSLTLCMATVAEAGAAAFDDFAAAETSAGDLFGDEAGQQPAPDTSEPVGEQVPEQEFEEVTPAPEEVEEITPAPEEVTPVPEETPAPEEETPVPDDGEVEIFDSQEERNPSGDTEIVMFSATDGGESEVLAAPVDDFTVTQDNWEEVGGKWKLRKNSSYSTSGSSAEPVAAAEPVSEVSFETDPVIQDETADAGLPDEGETEPVNEADGLPAEELSAAPAQEDTDPQTIEPSEEGVQEIQYEEETPETLQEEPNPYFTDQDGLVEIKIVDSTNTQISIGKYLFDAEGYLITGQKKMVPGTVNYTPAAEKEYFFMDKANAVLNSGIAAGTSVTPYNSNLGQAQKSYWLWTGKIFRYYDSSYAFKSVDELKNEQLASKTYKGYFRINGYDYCLWPGGTPREGIVKITEGTAKGEYCFMSAGDYRNNDKIPGKMIRSGWYYRKVNGLDQWRYYKADGTFYSRGIVATKLDSKIVPSVREYTFLISASGYVLKNKLVTAENKGVYITDKYGRIYKDRVLKYGKYRYYFGSDGKRVSWKNGWYRCPGAGNRYYYFGSSAGRIVEKTGWQKITVNGKFQGWFYFSRNGNHYIDVFSGSRYFRPDGRLASGITKIGGKYYFFQISSSTKIKGSMYKNTWVSYKNNWYYADSDGVLYRSGWQKISGAWYYFQSNCTVKTNAFVKKGTVYGYLDEKGKFCTGWVIRNDSQNLMSYVDKTGKGFVKNTSIVISGKTYFFDARGYRINDISNTTQADAARVFKSIPKPYYVEVDRSNGVMTVYNNSSRTIPIKSIRVSVGNPVTLTPAGTYTLKRSARWQPLMGPSWGQYGTHVYYAGQGGIFVHSVACGQPNSYNLPAGEYNKLGSPASHGCIRCCVADAKWIYDNCNGGRIRIFDGTYQANETKKGPLGRPALKPLYGSMNFDPTDPAI